MKSLHHLWPHHISYVFRLKLALLLSFIAAIGVIAVFPKINFTIGQIFQKRPSFENTIIRSGIDSHPSFGGAAWGDFNNDGNQDLFLSTREGNKLYKNMGNGTFTDVTKGSGIAPLQSAFTASFGDYNNDGCLDLCLSMGGPIQTSTSPGEPDLLYRNNCNGTFTDVSKQAGITDHYHGTGVAWVDYNNDGNLDIYVSNYGVWKSDDDWTYEPNILYRNNGNGTFSDVSKQSGATGDNKCRVVAPFPRYPKLTHRTEGVRRLEGWKESFQPIWFDYDNDGKMDLFIATDYGVSPLYHNNGNGTFTDVTDQAGMCVRGSGMGVTAGDYNEDGYLDLYVTNGDRNFLWKNNRDGTFTEVSENLGVANFGSLGWGASFIDYNNDGHLDIYAVSGTVIMDAEVRKRFVNRHDRLLKNNGQGLFSDVAEVEGLSGNDPKLAAAVADYNNDGFTDVFVVSDLHRRTADIGVNRLYTNRPNGNHWLTIQLVGTKSNRDGVGARITAETKNGSQVREINAGSSYTAENSLWPTFGLGSEYVVSKLEINWPSGIKQTLTNIRANQKITVTEGSK